jgi:hypothetical protein
MIGVHGDYVSLPNLVETDIDNDSVLAVMASTAQQKGPISRFNLVLILHVPMKFNWIGENVSGKNGRNGAIAINLEDKLEVVLAILR